MNSPDMTSTDPAATEDAGLVGVARLGPGQRALIVIGVAAMVGVGVWLLTGKNGDPSPMASFAANGEVNARIVPKNDLAEVPAEVDHPVFWAGNRAGSEYEVRDDASGNVHFRYLTGGAPAGDTEQTFLDIGTYPFTGAYKATKSLANGDGVVKVKVGKAIGFYQKNRPYSVILSFPSRPDLQIEVYHPEKNGALAIVKQGDIVPMP